jgi:hypothetical protein
MYIIKINSNINIIVKSMWYVGMFEDWIFNSVK